MKQIVEGGKVGININGEDGHFFNTYKGLRQGDPLSPLLFNLVSDELATMFENAKRAGQIRGLVPNLIEGGLTHL
jgi:retron-type reverse transcriptase